MAGNGSSHRIAIDAAIFEKPSIVLGLLKKGNIIPSEHQKFLCVAGEILEPIPFCSFCHERKVKLFMAPERKPSYELMSCANEECEQQLIAKHPGEVLYPVKLSSLHLFKEEEQPVVARFIGNLIGLPKDPTPEDAFAVLKRQYEQYWRNFRS
jgi:hypothetical protein